MSKGILDFKDSGIPWIGGIPKHWAVIRNKYVLNHSKKIVGGKFKEFQILSLTKNGIKAITENDQKGKVPESFDTYQIVKKDDIVMCLFDLDVSAVFSGISNFNGIISPAYKIFNPKKDLNFKYAGYFFDFVFDNRKFKQYSKNIRFTLGTDEFMNLRILVPPLDEQERIAEFLDKKCEMIDKRLENLEAKIQSLKEYKKALISECVTKGLNNGILEFRDSGIPWIGRIPKHWKIRPLYYFFKERKNKNLLGKEKNLLSLSYGKIIRKDIETKDGLLPENFNGYNIIEKDDIVFRLTDLQNDKVSLRTGLVFEKGIITSAYVTITAKTNIYVSFYHYLLHCYDLMKVFYNLGNGVRQGITYKELSKIKILVPPLDEQERIAEFLDKKCASIDKLKENYQSQIATLKEYKKSLIYECVSGKKEV